MSYGKLHQKGEGFLPGYKEEMQALRAENTELKRSLGQCKGNAKNAKIQRDIKIAQLEAELKEYKARLVFALKDNMS